MKKLFAIFLFLSLFFVGACDVKRGSLDVGGLLLNSYSFELSPSTTMVWKDAATITVQAGHYYIGGKLLNLATGTDWSWDLDTGSESSGTLTWYYLYTYNNAGTPDHVASLTAPTGRFDTNLSGSTYDTNQYLGPFVNDSGDDIEPFSQSKNVFMFVDSTGIPYNEREYHTGDISWTLSTIQSVPVTANKIYGELFSDAAFPAGLSSNGTNLTVWTANGDSIYVWCSLLTSQSFYIKTYNAGSTVYFETMGWIDKWL